MYENIIYYFLYTTKPIDIYLKLIQYCNEYCVLVDMEDG